MKTQTKALVGVVAVLAMMPVVTPYVLTKQAKKKIGAYMANRAMYNGYLAGMRRWWE